VARLEPGLGCGVEPSDPDRFAAELGLLAGQPFVVAAFFSDYATRETMIDAVAAEFQFLAVHCRASSAAGAVVGPAVAGQSTK
jgi:hypothetical protein